MGNDWGGYKAKSEGYDWTDEQGKGWRLKEGETLTELKLRAKGEKTGE
jgi:hypothetical protein